MTIVDYAIAKMDKELRKLNKQLCDARTTRIEFLEVEFHGIKVPLRQVARLRRLNETEWSIRPYVSTEIQSITAAIREFGFARNVLELEGRIQAEFDAKTIDDISLLPAAQACRQELHQIYIDAVNELRKNSSEEEFVHGLTQLDETCNRYDLHITAMLQGTDVQFDDREQPPGPGLNPHGAPVPRPSGPSGRESEIALPLPINSQSDESTDT